MDLFFINRRSSFLFKISSKNYFDYPQNNIFDFLNKKKTHFETDQAFQFLYRINYSFDCYLLAVHYSLFLTYFLFFFHFGLGVKTRLKLPIFKFNNSFSTKLHTNKLKF